MAARRPEVDRLVRRCGALSHLVPDALLVGRELLRPPPAAESAQLGAAAAGDAARWLTAGPLWEALQHDWATECRRCLPQTSLSVRGASRIDYSDDDHTAMVQIGWTPKERLQEAPELQTVPTDNPGFVTLRWARTAQCEHDSPLSALPADRIRRLMWHHCRVLYSADSEITVYGPEVHVRQPDAADDGTSFIPCLHLPQWPLQEFLTRPRETDFPAEAVRREISQFGVHLVPTGCPGSTTESSEWLVSFCRAEQEAFRHLSPVQRAAADAVQYLQSRGNDSGPALTPQLIRTAVFWLAQDMPSDRWTGVTDGAQRILDWLELRLRAGSVPCFFSEDINLVAGLSDAEVESLTEVVVVLRRKASRLLLAWCQERYGLDVVLEGGSEPLSERELGLRLARQLVRQAVTEGVLYRPTAPCWVHWVELYAPIPRRPSAHPSLELYLHSMSGACRRQCLLLQALVVAPAEDLVQSETQPDEEFTWDVTPLLSLLTESDLQHLMGDPAAIAEWCQQQLSEPQEKRPAGLTAELDTPRGRAELLLQPELLLQAATEAASGNAATWRSLDQVTAERWQSIHSAPLSYRKCREELETLLSSDLETRLRRQLPELDGPTAAAIARPWQQQLQRLLTDGGLQEKYTSITTPTVNQWEMRWDAPIQGQKYRMVM